MSQNAPAYLTVSGISRFAVSERDLEREIMVPKQENSWTYITLAAAVNVGLKIIESPEGRESLQALGLAVIDGWHARGEFAFRGNPANMSHYVEIFLSALRNDFPNVMVDDLELGPGALASAVRLPIWDGNLLQYEPKRAVTINFNYAKVADMVAASVSMYDQSLRRATTRSSNRGSGSRGTSGSSVGGRSRRVQTQMRKRYQDFQFMFGVATAHELCHAFVAFLSQNEQDTRGYTPPGFTHLNYASYTGVAGEYGGEAGRWFENHLFGGSFEFYFDDREDAGQTGIPYIVDRYDIAWQVNPDIIERMIQDPQTILLPGRPFPIIGDGLSRRRRVAEGLRSLGSTNSGAWLPAGPRYMQPRYEELHFIMYNLREEDLRRAAWEAMPLRAIRVE